MRLRSFHGENLSEAMRQVREALGINAVIVATRDDEQGGVRVTAAQDDALAEAAASPPPHTPPTPKAEPLPPPPEAPLYDVVDLVAEQLMRHALPPTLSESILSIVTHFADHDVLIALGAAMDKLYRFGPLADPAKPRPICLVGPPGAGKTLAAAKIVTNRVLNRKSVGIITTDLTRAGAVEQLAAYTRILKLNLFEVENPTALKDAVEGQKSGEYLVVDNAGRNPFNKADMDDLKRYIAAADMEPVVVIPAGMDAHEAADVARAFMELGAKKAILTKIDLARRLGSLLAMAHDTGLQLCEMSLSANVAEPLQPLNAVTLARLLLPPAAVARALKKASA